MELSQFLLVVEVQTGFYKSFTLTQLNAQHGHHCIKSHKKF